MRKINSGLTSRKKEAKQVSTSPTFPRLPIPELVAEVLAGSSKRGRSTALRAFRQKIKQLLSS